MLKTKQNKLQEAITLHDAGLLPEAKKLYRKVLRKQPTQAEALYRLGLIALQENKSEEAADLIANAIRIKPHQSDYHCNLAVALMGLGQTDQALENWETAITLNPSNPDSFSNMAGAYIQSKRYEEAEKYAGQALTLAPKHNQALQKFGACLLNQKKHRPAYEFLLKAIQTNPKQPDYQTSAGYTAVQLGKIEQALDHFGQALILAPDHEDALYGQISTKIISMPMEKRGDICMEYLNHPQPAPLHRASILLKLTIHFCAIRDFDYAKKCIDMFIKTPVYPSPLLEKTYEIYNAFMIFLQRLSNTKPPPHPNPLPDDKIFLIGDSHCLSYATETISVENKDHYIVPFFIEGAKAWHLGDGQAAKYDYVFRAALTHRPQGAKCWIICGEIDCRVNEGIQTVPIKDGQSLENIARNTATSYIKRTASIVREHGVTPTYVNVPAPHIVALAEQFPSLTKQDLERHKQTIDSIHNSP